MKILVTGATGKVGRAFLTAFLDDDRYASAKVVALCHNRGLDAGDRVEVVSGSLSDPQAVAHAMDGVTHVLHMAAVKETPDLVIDVAIKGMFLLLEAARQSSTLKQFVLISGDCTVGHIFKEYSAPINEVSPRKAYSGCYALTKVLEEVMIEQYQIQYGLNGTVLRAPWIMEKDDFKYALSFGEEQFGGPAWSDLIGADKAMRLARGDFVPLMRDRTGASLKRNFVHVDDLVMALMAVLDHAGAMQELFNIAMDEPVDYAQVAEYLARTRDMEAVEIPTPFHSNWLDNTKVRHVLGWRPQVDFGGLIERAWSYERSPGDPRKIWYPG
ncbi:NAD(P)-dependent oxidoreductase [Thalassospira sp. GO-4]|jgi:nucleoside-diphosphate-sugar epimerase|uniref:NAD-dependent epimerase/dehydratase family protein n=1 Tax=Thalassospira sp. GO-4 TaxID=2946605 RepID=UPI0020245B75|nr:NAD(P)-dependent oxidoreductase [Thalassospira sp. GO-4]URK17519.1 NAD(P)-dependent oxidoreductase [Thalassospira sp. GO-4]